MNVSKAQQRWAVHLALILTVIISLAFEFVLTFHIVFGLIFVAFVIVHLTQRRRTSGRLVRRLLDVKALNKTQGRLAMADLLLLVLTIGMLVSGFWDWSLGHPTRIRYHALVGVGLAVLLLVHSVTRRKRLRTSKVR